jgi:hypothetical protein
VARSHGKDVRVYLDGRDISGHVASVNTDVTVDVHDVTTFASSGWKESTSGLGGWTGSIEGFYDNASSGFASQVEAAFGSTASGDAVLSWFDGAADGVGDAGFLGSEAIVTQRSTPVNIADLVKLSAEFQGNGRAGAVGRLLHPLSSSTASSTGATLDNGGESANGGRGTLHVMSVTGTWAFTIAHSSDDTSFSALVSFTNSSSTGAETIEVAGTVKRYLRYSLTNSSAGVVDWVAGFARY